VPGVADLRACPPLFAFAEGYGEAGDGGSDGASAPEDRFNGTSAGEVIR